MKEIDIFTDGACLGNPGPGGWAAILRFNGQEKEIFGSEHETTNNRMELTAVIEALKKLKEPCKINLYSDSKYVCDVISKGWAQSWKRNGWKKSDKKPALNSDLWEKALSLIEINRVSVFWIKGHDGHRENERCDKLASSQAKLA
ncbi:MAG: ribonuclease HI [Oscillospiraceae bacterium]|jgi:ribonuclease HI|nr:ribonuclease HI [Oscillospiraceae bacterium]